MAPVLTRGLTKKCWGLGESKSMTVVWTRKVLANPVAKHTLKEWSLRLFYRERWAFHFLSVYSTAWSIASYLASSLNQYFYLPLLWLFQSYTSSRLSFPTSSKQQYENAEFKQWVSSEFFCLGVVCWSRSVEVTARIIRRFASRVFCSLWDVDDLGYLLRAICLSSQCL